MPLPSSVTGVSGSSASTAAGAASAAAATAGLRRLTRIVGALPRALADARVAALAERAALVSDAAALATTPFFGAGLTAALRTGAVAAAFFAAGLETLLVAALPDAFGAAMAMPDCSANIAAIAAIRGRTFMMATGRRAVEGGCEAFCFKK